MALTSEDRLNIICKDLKSCDKDSYLTALFLGRRHSAALWTVYGFNCELAKISRQVQEPMLGKIRVQWWRDVIDQAGNATKIRHGHPVADQMVELFENYNFSPHLFHAIIDAREQDQGTVFLQDLPSFHLYHQNIWSNLYQLAWHIAHFDSDKKCEDEALDLTLFRLAGEVTGLVRFLLKAPPHEIKTHIELVLKEKLVLPSAPDQVIDPALHRQIDAYQADQAQWLRDKSKLFQEKLARLKQQDQEIFLPLAMTAHYIKQLDKRSAIGLSIVPQPNPFRQFLTLWGAKRKGLSHYTS